MPNVGEIIIQKSSLKRKRDKDDFYETDPMCIHAYIQQCLNNHRMFLDGSTILDPGCGTGVYGKVLRKFYPNAYLIGVEKQANRFPNPGCYDLWLDVDYMSNPIYTSNVIGNPPYKLAEQFLFQSIKNIQGHGHINFLLRLGFLESERRYAMLWSKGIRPTTVTVLNTRPSFTGDGNTYPTAFCFMDWHFINGKCQEDSKLEFLTFERK